MFVVPGDQRRVILVHAQDLPSAGHKEIKGIKALKPTVYCPGMNKDVQDYVKGGLDRGQFLVVRREEELDQQVLKLKFRKRKAKCFCVGAGRQLKHQKENNQTSSPL